MKFGYRYTIIEDKENIPPFSGPQTECGLPGAQSALESVYPSLYSILSVLSIDCC